VLWLSEILMQEHNLQSFDDLVAAVRRRADGSEMFFRMDVKPPFQDTPNNWEDRLEAAFTASRA
jgi:hypothetical protein